MTNSDLVDACSDLLVQLRSVEVSHSLTARSYQNTITALDHVVSSSDPNFAVSEALFALTQYVTESCSLNNGNSHATALLATLANATRNNPIWRSLFGPVQSHASGKKACILDVAQDVVAKSSSEDQIDQLDSALRLIANCCADNNLNRKHFLNRNGMLILVDHLIDTPKSDLLIPTLYNVCNDYEEPEPGIDQSSTSLEQVVEDQAHITSVSLAAKKLAAACADRTDFMTFELFLAPPTKPSQDRVGFLAGLIELAALPATNGIQNILGNRVSSWKWSFTYDSKKVQTLEAASELANKSTECRVSILRAILYVMSQEEARQAFLTRHDDSILHLVELATFLPPSDDDDDPDEFEEEIIACHKEFFKLFYEITGTPEFLENEAANLALGDCCLKSLSGYSWLGGKNQHDRSGATEQFEVNSHVEDKVEAIDRHARPTAREFPFMKSCALVMLAQLSIKNQLREIILKSEPLLETITSIFNTSSNPDALYPAITLVTRLAMGSETLHVLGSRSILQAMKRLIITGGLGLVIPYETVNAYRLLLKGRPESLIYYTQNSDDGSIISKITILFDRTFEAGTKLEIGHFFIEILRTIFPSFKDTDNKVSKAETTEMVATFDTIMTHAAVKIAEILTFVCTQAEPKGQRIHGWFGLGMLSVWSQGRSAIIDAIEFHDLDQGILEVFQTQDGPALQNLKLMLSKMRLCSTEKLPEKTKECLSEATRNLNLQYATDQ